MDAMKGNKKFKKFIDAKDVIKSCLVLMKNDEEKDDWLVKQIISVANSAVHHMQKRERILIISSFLSN